MDSLRQLATFIVELPFDLAPDGIVQNAVTHLNGAEERLGACAAEIVAPDS